MDRKRYIKFMCEKVMPAIREKWPDQPGVGQQIRVNVIHDNARPHFEDHQSEEWMEASASANFIARLVQQPAQSPDCNILDLGFFNGLQKRQFSLPPASNIEQLIERVETAFEKYDPRVLNRVFLTHMMVMEEILLCDGENDYKMPHMAKEKLERQGNLPKVLQLGTEAYDKYKALL